jgi:hypothetical protein
VERLWAPWWWWPPALGLAGLVAAELHTGYPGVRSWLSYLALGAATVVVLLLSGRTRVGLQDAPGGRVLRAGAAVLPVRFVAGASVITATDKRAALGRGLDPAAFVLHRPWVGALIMVRLDDPEDPTPYWVVSCRRPEALAAALNGLPGPDEAAARNGTAGPGTAGPDEDRRPARG